MSQVGGTPWDFNSSAGEGIEEGVIPQRTDSLLPDPPMDLPPRMRTRRTYIRRVEVGKYGPTRGCPGCQKVMSGAVPSCIVATHNDECRERMEKLMMQDLEGADRVVRTKTRINDALARHIEEHDERAKKIAKHDHHKASSDQNQASSSSSSCVVRSPEEQQGDSQDDAKMNEDDHGQIGGKIDPESNKEEKMSIDDQQESRRSEDDDREAKRQRLASVTTSQPKPELMNTERFWDHLNGGELDAHEVRKARQLEVDYLNKIRVFERVPYEVAKARMRKEPIKVRWVDTLKGSGIHRSRLVAALDPSMKDSQFFQQRRHWNW